jgi:hypothetical protein
MNLKNKIMKNKLLIALFFCVIVCLYPIYNKILYEKQNNVVEIAYSLDTIYDIYNNSGVYFKTILNNFQEAGLTSIILKEDTIQSLINTGKATLLRGKDILNDNRIHRGQYSLIFSRLPRNYVMQPDYGYLFIDENKLFEFVKRNLEIKLGNNRVRDLGWNILEIIAPNEQLIELSLDINPDKVNMIKSYNLSVIPELNNFYAFSEEQISSKLSELNKLNIQTIFFSDNEILGYNNLINISSLKINEFNFFFTFREFLQQKGLHDLSFSVPNKAIKLHYLVKAENYQKGILLSRAIRSIKERNVRILHLDYLTENHTFSETTYEEEIKFLQELVELIKSEGYDVGTISNITKPEVSFLFYFQIISYLAVFIITIFFVRIFLIKSSYKEVLIIPILLSLIGLLAFYFNKLFLYNDFMSFLVATVTPVIIFVEIKKLLDAQKFNSFKHYLISILLIFLSVFGVAIIINTLFFHYDYFVGLRTFRGVKLANTLPILIFAIYLFIKPKRLKYMYHVLDRYLSGHINFKYLSAFLLLIIFMGLYILRTGNYGMLVFGQMEIIFRDLLESIFVVRPRVKEIFFAIPLLVLAISLWSKPNFNSSIKNILLLFSSILMISQINTFCHIHAPFILSLFRIIIGLAIGSVLGFFLLLFIDKLIVIIYKIEKQIYSWEN